MNRRRMLVTGATVVAGALVGTRFAAEWQLQQWREADPVAWLRALHGQSLHSRGVWRPAQIFNHLAQSIEYSLTGYPQAKSALFQHTVGAAAYTAFAAAGSMTHDLAEPIPGAPALADTTDANAAIERLLSAWQAFEQHPAALAPHFAYGNLDKRQYRAAHLMHIRNHLQEIHIAGE